MADISLFLHEQRVFKNLAYLLPSLFGPRILVQQILDHLILKRKMVGKNVCYRIFALNEIFIQGDLGVDKRTENQDFTDLTLWNFGLACLRFQMYGRMLSETCFLSHRDLGKEIANLTTPNTKRKLVVHSQLRLSQLLA